jgi:prefoldin subunit 5
MVSFMKMLGLILVSIVLLTTITGVAMAAPNPPGDGPLENILTRVEGLQDGVMALQNGMSGLDAAINALKNDVNTIKSSVGNGDIQTKLDALSTKIDTRMTTVDGSITGVGTKVDAAAQKIGAIQTDTGTIKAGISDIQSSLDDIQDQVSQINVNREPTAYEWYITIMYDNYDRDLENAEVFIVNYDYFVSQKTDDVTVEFIETYLNKEIRQCSGTKTVQRDSFFWCDLPDSGALDLLVKVTTHSRAVVPMIKTVRGGTKLYSGDFAVFPIYS